jgi:hypothetical protein
MLIVRDDLSKSDQCQRVRSAPVQREHQMNDIPSTPATETDEAPRKPLPPAAQRALAEAEARRAATAANAAAAEKEFNGPTGPEPTRFGDWERKGIASDF